MSFNTGSGGFGQFDKGKGNFSSFQQNKQGFSGFGGARSGANQTMGFKNQGFGQSGLSGSGSGFGQTGSSPFGQNQTPTFGQGVGTGGGGSFMRSGGGAQTSQFGGSGFGQTNTSSFATRTGSFGSGSGRGSSSGFGVFNKTGSLGQSGTGGSGAFGKYGAVGSSTGSGAMKFPGGGLGQSNFGVGGFGSSQNQSFQSRQWGGQQFQQSAAAEAQNKVVAELETIGASYSPENQIFAFTHYFYDKKGEGAPAATRPNYFDKKYNLAVENNPDPVKLEPVRIVSFQNLLQRYRNDVESMKKQEEKLETVKKELDGLATEIRELTTKRLNSIIVRNQALVARTLALMKKHELHRLSGTWYRDEEKSLKSKLEEIQKEIEKPDQFMSKIKDLDSRKQLRLPKQSIGFNEDSLDAILDFLEKQQEGLEVLKAIIIKDARDLKLIEEHKEATGSTRR